MRHPFADRALSLAAGWESAFWCRGRTLARQRLRGRLCWCLFQQYGSLTARGCPLRAEDRMPGPGSYDPSMDLVRQRSTSAQILLPSSSGRKVKRPAESAPGPGHYEVEQPQRAKNALIPPKPTAKRRVEAEEAKEPGPGEYEPNFGVVEPTVRGGAIARAKASDSSADLTTLRRRLKERNSEKALKVARGESTEEVEREISQLASRIAERRAPDRRDTTRL